MFLCYIAQHAPADVTTHHRTFGIVAACHAHDPHRHGYGLPFPFKAPAAATQASQPTQDAPPAPPSGGARVPRNTPPPTRPPAPRRISPVEDTPIPMIADPF